MGGAYFGRVVDRGGRPLRIYGLLEAGIGVFAFLMPALLSLVTVTYVWLARHLDVGFYGTHWNLEEKRQISMAVSVWPDSRNPQLTTAATPRGPMRASAIIIRARFRGAGTPSA